MNDKLPAHLGGHLNKTHTDRGTLLFLINNFGIKSMLDIGCGTGGMIELARLRDVDAYGIDGDFTIEYPKEIAPYIIIHDFTQGIPSFGEKTYDLAWSVEFLEHVEEEYQDNYMQAFAKCKYAIVTAAPPGYSGYHHVNCRDEAYWIEVFGKYGFEYDSDITKQIREKESTMQKPFMQNTSMFFRKKIDQ